MKHFTDTRNAGRTAYAKLPRAPLNASPVPRLTSLYHHDIGGAYGNRTYPGNCSGELIKDLLTFFGSRTVLDPMTGSGTCRDVCRELDITCRSFDLRDGFDACDPATFPADGSFDFCWAHPPYWRMKRYSDDPRDLSTAPTLEAFLERYAAFIANCRSALRPGGKLAILMGDYHDMSRSFIPLVYHTKRLAFSEGFRPACTDIIRFSHGASSSTKVYRTAFIPSLHDVCAVFEKPR